MILPKHTGADITIFSEMSALSLEHGAVNLSQGFPDFPIDERLRALLAEATHAHFNQYAPMQGLPMLREAIAHNKFEHYQINIHPQQILITSGATYGLYISLKAILNTGEEVIILDPSYDSYRPAVEMNGGTTVHVSLNLNDFSPNWDSIKAAITKKTKAIIINTPHNPSGYVWTNADFKELEEIVLKNSLYVIADEVYEHLVFEPHKMTSIIQYPSIAPRVIAIYSFGKMFQCTGWKLGYLITHPDLMPFIQSIHQYLNFSVNTPAQWACAQYLNNEYTRYNNMLQSKRDLVIDTLHESVFTMPFKAQGGYFQLIAYPTHWKGSDHDIAKELIKAHKIALIPCDAFYGQPTKTGLLRLCFAKNEQTLKQGIEKLCNIKANFM